jgi:predicted acyltransferase
MRGFVMLALCWGLLARGPLSQQSATRTFAEQFRHVSWEGLVFWDLIQPAFWFVVGAALPFALERRLERGATFGQNLRHASARALKLILLGQILICLGAGRYRFDPRETLTQLAASYFLCFLLFHLRFQWQAAAAALMMTANWGLYVLFPGSSGPLSPTDNIGTLIDRAVFGLSTGGSWVTINFLGSTVNMLVGVWTGVLLMGKRPHPEKLQILAAAAAASLALALVLTPFNPPMQKIWTASYTFWGAGYVLLVVAVCFWLFDIEGYRKPAFPLVVVGMNSIFIYMLSQALGSWIDKSLGVFTGRFQFLGPLGAISQACAVVLVMWCVCFWLYRRKVFFKV